jgi:pilus assembly protein CpaE
VNGSDPEAHALARTVLVFSGKGGIGKSVLATNLATALAVDGASVAMVDLNLQYGDLGVLLRLEAHPTSIEAVAALGDGITIEILHSVMATSEMGVRVLLAPSNPELGDLVTAASLETILTQLSLEHDFVVVDSPAHLEERIVGVMQMADHILLVSSFDITSVKDAKTTLRLLQSLGIERERVTLVLNQTRPRSSFPAKEVEKALRFPVLSSLPYEPGMDESVDNGRPLVLTEPRSGYSRQLRLIVEHLQRATDPGAPAKAREHASEWRLRFGR